MCIIGKEEEEKKWNEIR